MTDDFQEQLKQARRTLILNAAIDVIAAQGFQRTTIKQIAKKAGVADGTIYNYFKNKGAIMEGIVARMTATEMQDM
ncbi:MAG: TetR/AcrR family transcriptional regulator, partial [Aggregatilineales bacterium]